MRANAFSGILSAFECVAMVEKGAVLIAQISVFKGTRKDISLKNSYNRLDFPKQFVNDWVTNHPNEFPSFFKLIFLHLIR